MQCTLHEIAYKILMDFLVNALLHMRNYWTKMHFLTSQTCPQKREEITFALRTGNLIYFPLQYIMNKDGILKQLLELNLS